MKKNGVIKAARHVQKSFAKITSDIGTPADPPKPRGIQSSLVVSFFTHTSSTTQITLSCNSEWRGEDSYLAVDISIALSVS